MAASGRPARISREAIAEAANEIGLSDLTLRAVAEGRMDQVLQDAHARRLKPLYNYMNDLPGLEALVTGVEDPGTGLVEGAVGPAPGPRLLTWLEGQSVRAAWVAPEAPPTLD